jgi:hypothetical protein
MLFQILVNNDWPDTMYRAVSEYGYNTAAFFVVYYCIACIVMLNLLTAVFVDIFMAQTEVRDKGKSLAKILQAQGVVLPESHASPNNNTPSAANNDGHGNGNGNTSLLSPTVNGGVSPSSGITNNGNGGNGVISPSSSSSDDHSPDPSAPLPNHRVRASIVAPGAPAFLRARSHVPQSVDMRHIDARLEYVAQGGFGSSSDVPVPQPQSPSSSSSAAASGAGVPSEATRLTVPSSPSSIGGIGGHGGHARNRSGGFTSGEWKRNVHAENQQRFDTRERKLSTTNDAGTPQLAPTSQQEVSAAIAADLVSPNASSSSSSSSSGRMTVVCLCFPLFPALIHDNHLVT